MPESRDFGSFDLIEGPVIFLPNDLNQTGPVKKSQDQGGKGRQKWHVFRNIAAICTFFVYIGSHGVHYVQHIFRLFIGP